MSDFPISIRRATPENAAGLKVLTGDEAVYGNLLQLPYLSEALWRDRPQAKQSAGELQLLAIGQGLVGLG